MTGPTRQRPRSAGLDPDELAALEEERDFLLTSLDDLEREHDAGDLEDGDYESLKDDYTARAAEVLRAIDERRQAFAEARRPRRRGRTVAVVTSVVTVAMVAGMLMAQASGRRTGNESATGAIRRTPTQEAQACLPVTFSVAEDPSKVIEAQECFKVVLDQDPRNPTALTYLGWALLLSGDSRLVEPGRGFLLRAIQADPDYPDAYAFLAIVAARSGDYAEADRYLDRLDQLDPAPEIAGLTEGLRAEVEEALAKPSTTTSGATMPTTTATPTPTTQP